MYTAFYGLREKPFSLTPNPRFLYLADSHREARAHLLYGLEPGEGFIVITGEVGTGKTTICRSLLERLGAETEVAILLNPSQSATELLQAISEEFELPSAGLSRRALLSRLNRFLLEKSHEGRRVVLIVDEAQNLSAATLEQIRLISNLETATRKLIQIILLGQPELDDKLDSDDLRQLRQRVSVRWSLQPLPRRDSFGYVRHRLRVAAGAEREILSEGALREIHRRTGGVPRLINVLTDRVLLAGYAAGAHRIGARIVRRAAREVPDVRRRQRQAPRPALRGARVFSAAAMAAGLLAGLGYAWLQGGPALRGWLDGSPAALQLPPVSSVVALPQRTAEEPPLAAAAVLEAPAVALDAPPPLRDEEAWFGLPEQSTPLARTAPAPADELELGQGIFLAVLLSEGDGGEVELRALNGLLELYGEAPLPSLPDGAQALEARLAERTLTLETLVDGDLEQVRRLGYPALLRLRGEGDRVRSVALVGLDGEVAELAGIGRSGRLRVPITAVEERWDGDPRIVWRHFERIPSLFGYGDSGAAVLWLQEALGRLGHLDRGITGRYDARTVAGVQDFQRLHGIAPDGVTGPLTLMLLYDELEEYAPPRLAEEATRAPGEAG